MNEWINKKINFKNSMVWMTLMVLSILNFIHPHLQIVENYSNESMFYLLGDSFSAHW